MCLSYEDAIKVLTNLPNKADLDLCDVRKRR